MGRWKVHEDFFSSVAGGLESAWDDGVSRCFYVGDFREADRSEYTSSLQESALPPFEVDENPRSVVSDFLSG